MQHIGTEHRADGTTHFRVWAPFAKKVRLKIVHPEENTYEMKEEESAYWWLELKDADPGTRYFYLLDGEAFPDPASRFQPEGVHGPSEVVSPDFNWEDKQWKVPAFKDFILYELHTGTFSQEGTFDGVIQHLNHLKETGINAISLMPVAQFPGERNWGYDGVYPYAVQNSYGGPAGLKKLVNACHREGLAVILDVVYNHLGPEGNYFDNYGPYFTSKYKTPWGKAINFDDQYSDPVRNYFLSNALYWFKEFHIDGLRLDAVHAIFDNSAYPFLRELADLTALFDKENKSKHYLISESALNDTKVVKPATEGGWGHDAHWMDDFHHAVHALLTGESTGYYEDYGEINQLMKVLSEGYRLSGGYSKHKKRRYGLSSREIPGEKLVIFIQNHDETGNRLKGDRLSDLVSFEQYKWAASLMLLAPYVPMLFMGEEYGEDKPFMYFIDHSDKALIEAVRRGRRREFRSFKWKGRAPDPYDPETFIRSKPGWDKKYNGKYRLIHQLYKDAIRLRKENPVLNQANKFKQKISIKENILEIERWNNGHTLRIVTNFSDQAKDIANPGDYWKILFNTAYYGQQKTKAESRSKEINLQPYQLLVFGKEK